VFIDYAKYTYEFYWCLVFTLMILVFIKGRSANDTIANAWSKGVAEAISANFAHIGTLKDPSLALDKVTLNDYNYYASGRVNCMYALFKVELKRRQCLFSMCTLELIWPRKDMVTIEIPIRVPDGSANPDGTVSKASIPLEFMIVSKRNMKATLQQNEQLSYLKNFVGPVQAEGLKNAGSDGGLVVLAESEDAANYMIDNSIGELLSKLGEQHIHEIHFTDQKAYNNYPMWLKATFYVDTSSEERLREAGKLINMVLKMVDKSISLRLTGKAKEKAERVRKAIEKQKAKAKEEENEEAILAKKKEKEQLFKEKLKKLPADQQRKMEEKKKEKDREKMKKKLSKMVKF